LLNELKRDLERNSLNFGFNDGQISEICINTDDVIIDNNDNNNNNDVTNDWTLNVKKAIISSLQMSAKNLENRSVVMETDFLGNCETVYEPLGQRYSQIVVKKTKQLNKCTERQETEIGFFPNSYALNEWIGRTTYPLLNTSYECEQTIGNDIIVSVKCLERQQLFSSLQVSSEMSLEFEREVQGLSVRKGQQMSRHTLLMTSHKSDVTDSEINESELINHLQQICNQLETNSVQELTQSYSQLIQMLQKNSEQNSIQTVFQTIPNICSQKSQKLSDMYLDACASAASQGSVQVLTTALTSGAISRARASYLFSLLAFASRPSPRVVEYVLPLLEQNETPEQVLLGISGLLHNLKQQNLLSNEFQRNIVQKLYQQLQQSLNNNNNDDTRTVVLLRSLENIGLDESADSQVLNSVYELSENERTRDGVRVAAIQLLRESMNERIGEKLIQRVFSSQRNSIEVRLNAYKSVLLSGKVTTGQLQTIKQVLQREESNSQLSSYVLSLWNNVKRSSDPFKQNIIPEGSVDLDDGQQQQDNQRWWSIESWLRRSKNYELSYTLPGQTLGVVLESDVFVEKNENLFNSLIINGTVPLMGKELHLFEIQFRQKGLQNVLTQILNNLNGDWFTSYEKISQTLRQLLENVIQNGGQNVWLEINVKIDGKNVLLLNSERARQQWQEISQELRELYSNGNGNRVEIERIFSLQPINTRLVFPQMNGFPLEMRVNQTLLAGISLNLNKNDERFETQMNSLFSLKTEMSFEFKVKNEVKNKRFVTELTSNPSFDVRTQVRDQRIVDLKLNFPEEKQSLIRFQTNFQQNGGNNYNNYGMHYNNRRQKTCSTTLSKVIGFSVCTESENNFSLFGQNFMEISIEKNDKSLKSLEISVEIPAENSREMRVWKGHVATPGSQIDREINVEFVLLTPLRGKNEAKLTVRSPWQRWTVVTSYVNDDRERAVQLSVSSDERKLIDFDVGVDVVSRGQKREYRPRIRLAVEKLWTKPLEMKGSISFMKGKKNQIQVQVQGLNSRQLIKGQIVREIESGKKFRVSTDFAFNLSPIEMRLIGLTDRSDKHLTNDLLIDYKLFKNQLKKESIKMSAKVQNLTQSSLTKMSVFGELISSQFPENNFHFAYNLLKKPFEHFENELTVTWSQQLREKFHVLQVSKYSPQDMSQGMVSRDNNNNNNKRVMNAENSIVVELSPLNINYELKSNALFDRREKNPKYSVDLSGKDRNGRKEYDLKAKFDYRQVSKSPLYLTMDASFKAQNKDYQYRDELREMSRNEFQGKTNVKWGKNVEKESADLEYFYRIKNSDKNKFHHEFDAQLMTPFHWFNDIEGHERSSLRHSSVLKMSSNEIELNSKLNKNGEKVFDLKTILSKKRESRVNLLTNGVEARVNVNPYTVPQLAELELKGVNIEHKTNVEMVPKLSLNLRSETKRDSKPIFSIDSLLTKDNNRPSRVVVNCHPYDGRVDWESSDNNGQQVAALELNNRGQHQSWSHSTQYKAEPLRRSVGLKSKTVLNGNQVLNIDSEVLGGNQNRKSFLNIEIPENYLKIEGINDRRGKTGNLELKTRDISHKSSIDWGNDENLEKKINSQTFYNRKEMIGLSYSKNDLRHNLEVQTPDHWSELSGQYYGEKPFVKYHLKVKPQHYEHLTQIQNDFNENNVLIESKTEKRGQNLFSLNGLLSRDSESNIRVVRPEQSARLTISPFEGRKSAKFEYNSNNLDHVTHIHTDSDQSWNVESNTKENNNNNRVWNLSVNKERNSGQISAQIPSFDSEMSYNCNNNNNNQRGKVVFSGKNGFYQPFKHLTEFETNEGKSVLRSKTEKQNRNLFSLDGEMNDVTNELGVKVGQNFESKVTTSLGGNEKQVNVNVKSHDLSHATNIGFDANTLLVRSRTDNNGLNVNKIDSKLTTNKGQKSYFSIQSQSSDANIEFEPKINRGKLDLNLSLRPGQQLSHFTEVRKNPISNGYEINSKTVNSGENVLELKSVLNGFHGNNELAVNSDTNGFWGELKGNKNEGKLELKTNELKHKTNYNLLNALDFESKTQTNSNQLLAHVIGHVSNDRQSNQHRLSIETNDYLNENSLDLNENRFQTELKSKLKNGRNLKMAFHVPNNLREFHSEISLNDENNENLKIDLNLNEMKNGLKNSENFEINFGINYSQNIFKALLQMNTNSLISGPHQLVVDYIPEENREKDSINVLFKHFINNNKMNCNLVVKEGNFPRITANLSVNKTNDGFEADFESITPKNPDLEYKVVAKQRKSQNQWDFESRAYQQSNKKFSLKMNLNKETRNELKGLLEIDVPELEINNQEMNVLLKLEEKRFELKAMNERGKQLELFSEMRTNTQTNSGEQSVVMEMKSNIQSLPSLSFNGKYTPNRELSVRLVKDEFTPLFDFWVNFSKFSSKEVEIEGKMESKFVPNLEILLKLKNNNFNEFLTQFLLKYNEKVVYNHEISAEKRGNVWTGTGNIQYFGKEFFSIQLNSEKSIFESFLKTKAFKSPLSLTFSHRSNDLKKSFIKICQNNENNENCGEFGLEFENNEKNGLINKIRLTFKKFGTNVLFEISFFELLKISNPFEQSLLSLVSKESKIVSKVKNSLLFKINEHSFGFENINTERENQAFDSLLKIMFPSNRALLFRIDSNGRQRESSSSWRQSSNNEWKRVVKTDFRNGEIERDSEPLFSTLTEINEGLNDISVKFSIESKKFERKTKTIELFLKREENKMSSKMAIDVSRDENNKLFVETELDLNEKNRTMSLNVWSRDRKHLDFESKSHLSSESFGIFWKNLNRNGIKTENYYFLRFLDNNRFEMIARDNRNGGKRISGRFFQKENEKHEIWAEIRVFDERKQLTENNIKLELNEKCLKYVSNEKSLDFCLNFDKKNSFQLKIDSLDKNFGQKTNQLLIELKKERNALFHVHWNPELLENALQQYNNYRENENNGNGNNYENNEYLKELKHKMVLIAEKSVIPFGEIYFDEISDLFQEIALNFEPIKQFVEISEQTLQQMSQSFQLNLRRAQNLKIMRPLTSIVDSFESIAKQLKRKCRNSENCYRMVYTIENYNLKTFFEYLGEKTFQFLAKNHKMIFDNWGKLYLNRISTNFNQILPQIIRNYLNERKELINESIQSIIDRNEVLSHLRNLLKEFLKENSQTIDWPQVKQSINQLWRSIIDESNPWLNSSARVVEWNPRNGDVTVEIVSPVPVMNSVRRLRSVLNKTEIKDNKEMKEMPKSFVKHIEEKIDSMKSMF
jgi:hypothetical protein